jgi:hypothetical protein
VREIEARVVLDLAEKGKLAVQDGLHDEDVTVEDLLSLLLPYRRVSSRAISLTLRALTGSREDVVVIHPSLLRKWSFSENDVDVRNQLGWYFHLSHTIAAPDPEAPPDVWETSTPKMVLLHLPHSNMTCEVLALCTVETTLCTVFLYGAGSQESEVQNALYESDQKLQGMLTRILANDAGKYAWWDRGQQQAPQFRLFSRFEITPRDDRSEPGLRLLDIAIKVLGGNMGDLFRYGRLAGARSSYAPPGADIPNSQEVRRLCLEKLFMFLCLRPDFRRTLRSPRKDDEKSTKQDVGQGLDPKSVNPTAFDPEVEAVLEIAETEAEFDDDQQEEDEPEFAGLKEEVMAAAQHELKNLAVETPSQEASIDDLSTALNKFRDGLPSYFEDEIQRRIDALSKVYDRSEYEITAEDEEKYVLKAGPAPDIRYQSGMLHSGQLCVKLLTCWGTRRRKGQSRMLQSSHC